MTTTPALQTGRASGYEIHGNAVSDGMEHKAFIPGTETKVLDEEHGIVEAIVAVTNVVDKVKDIYLPGAFEKSLSERTMKGMRGHDWAKTVAKALEQKELRPGDPSLPAALLALNAGALVVKAQYNMATQAGREAFEDVKFFGPDAEWSVGYRVNPEQTKTDRATGVRRIGESEMHEFSDVPFGANPFTGTLSVKSLLAEKAGETLEDDAPETFSVGPFKGLTRAEVDDIKERARAAAAEVAFERAGKALIPAVVVEGVLFTGDRILAAIEHCEKAEPDQDVQWSEGKAVTPEDMRAGLGRLEQLIAEKSKPIPLEAKDGRLPGSWEERQDAIVGAVSGVANQQFGGGTWCYMAATFADHAVVTVCPGPGSSYVDTKDGDTTVTWDVAYSIEPDGTVKISDPVEVELVSSVHVLAKALRSLVVEQKAGRVLKMTNTQHIKEAFRHLAAVAQSAGLTIEDLTEEEKADETATDETTEGAGTEDLTGDEASPGAFLSEAEVLLFEDFKSRLPLA